MTIPLIRADRISESEHEGEIVIVRLDSGELFSLRSVAADAWRLIDGNRDSAGLKQCLAAHYQAEADQISSDVDELLSTLREAGLLVGG